MKLGLFNLMTQRDSSVTPRQIVEDTCAMVRLADEVGFETAWFAEHHFSNYSICPTPLMMGAYAAGFTKRIKLGAAVLVLPFYNPLRMIEEIGLLDVQSGGRVKVGIGYGYQHHEFERFGRKPSEKVALALEAWDILEMGLKEGRVSYQGQHFQVPECPIAIRPLHQPDIFVTGLEPVILQRIARSGHTPFITAGWRGIALNRETRKHIDTQYRAAGVDPAKAPLAVQQYVFVTDDKAEALELAERARVVARIVAAMRAGSVAFDGHFIKAPPLADEPPLEVFRDNLVFGDPHYVAEKLVSEIRELGTTHLSVFMQIGSIEGKRACRSLERFAAEVVPLMEKAFGMPLAAVHAEREAKAG
jgi:alkanesulfonate monooxygenase SsuD/methylene tetrahydromethanopterin reductase-like flavin-dependent oxidoreductase (luciferase family)